MKGWDKMFLTICEACLLAVAAAIVIALTLVIIATVIYFAAAIVSSIIQAFKAVRAKQRLVKNLKNIDLLLSNIRSKEETEQENSSR